MECPAQATSDLELELPCPMMCPSCLSMPSILPTYPSHPVTISRDHSTQILPKAYTRMDHRLVLHQVQLNTSQSHLYRCLCPTLRFLWGKLSVLHGRTWLGEMSEQAGFLKRKFCAPQKEHRSQLCPVAEEFTRSRSRR